MVYYLHELSITNFLINLVYIINLFLILFIFSFELIYIWYLRFYSINQFLHQMVLFQINICFVSKIEMNHAVLMNSLLEIYGFFFLGLIVDVDY
jgi:hypothetical protein